jgi:hypothetical protein
MPPPVTKPTTPTAGADPHKALGRAAWPRPARSATERRHPPGPSAQRGPRRIPRARGQHQRRVGTDRTAPWPSRLHCHPQSSVTGEPHHLGHMGSPAARTTAAGRTGTAYVPRPRTVVHAPSQQGDGRADVAAGVGAARRGVRVRTAPRTGTAPRPSGRIVLCQPGNEFPASPPPARLVHSRPRASGSTASTR